jgi:hypothetical protein
VHRFSAETFLEQVLDDTRLNDLSVELRQQLLKIATMPPGAHVREFQKAFEEAARG